MRRTGLTWRHRCVIAGLLVFTGTLVFAAGAFADAGNPILGTIKASATQGTAGAGTSRPGAATVTIFVRGQWNWLSHGSDCNYDRAATGAAIIWNDVNGGGASAGTNEVQRIALTGTTTNAHFTVTFKNPAGTQSTSAAINTTDTAAQVDTKLEAMASIGAGNVSVTKSGNSWDVTFIGALAKTNVNAMSAGNKTGGLTVTISTITGGSAPVFNGYLVANGGVSAYVGSQGNDLNVTDRMVHPVDRGNQVEGYTVAGTDYPATQQFVDPASNNPNDFATWKGGCGRQPISAIASKPGNTERTNRNCATTPASNVCLNEPWGSWGYEKNAGMGYSHTYYADQLPDKVCVNFYDVHGGGTTAPKFQAVNNAGEITVDGNGDNSIDTNAFNVNDTSQGGNCIGIAAPTMVTTATDATIGDANGIHDTAVLSGVPSGVTGTLVFKAYLRTGPAADCTTAANLKFTSANIATTGSDTKGSGNFNPTSAGTYDWLVTWTSNDPLVLPVTSVCGDQTGGNDETSNVAKKQPSVTTDAGGPYTIKADGTFDLVDSATLHDAFLPLGASATITFKLYSDANCTQQVGSTSTVSITTNGSVNSDPITVHATGTFHWIANFGGDDNNFSTSNTCNGANESPVVNPRDTSITTDAGGPYTFDPVNGNDLQDKATLSDGTSDATGTLTFTLWSDAACTKKDNILIDATHFDPPAANTVAGADGDQYTSGNVHVTAAQTYHWTVHYGGDTKNNASDSACLATNENPQVLNPSIDIQKTPDNQTIETGTKATFTITVTNNGSTGLSNVTVSDPNSSDCNRTAAAIAALMQTQLGHGFPLAPTESVSYTCQSPTQGANTTLHNVATTSGTSQGVTVTDSDAADVLILHPNISVTKNPKSQSIPAGGTANWTIEVTNTGDTRLSNVVVTDAQASGCARTAAQTAPLIQAVGNLDAFLDPAESFHYNCSKVLQASDFDANGDFVNVVQACGDDVLTTTVCDTDSTGGGPPGCPDADRCGSVHLTDLTTKQDFLPRDTATLTGLVGAAGGTLTYSLFQGPGCLPANQLDLNGANAGKDLTQTVSGNNSYTAISASLLSTMLGSSNTAGTYNWLVSYSGDATTNNAAITGTCGTENFTVDNG
jgi:uncharacterized repeat protein (TIGR01451 family)